MLGARQDRRQGKQIDEDRRLEQQQMRDALKIAKQQRQDDKAAAKFDLAQAKAGAITDESDWKSKMMKALPWVAGAAVLAVVLLRRKKGA